MLHDNRTITALKKVIGWKDQTWTGVPALGSPLNDTEINQYYQSYHSAIRLDYIESLLERNRTIESYLDEVETEAIQELLNDIEVSRQLGNDGNTLATNDIIYNVGTRKQTIINESRFCGVMFELKNEIGINAIINRVGLYLTGGATNLDLYLFHSSQSQVVQKFQFNSTAANSFSWDDIRIQLEIDNGVIAGGVWYLGYYQDDLSAQSIQAVRYKAMNFDLGYCFSCDKGVSQAKYESITKHLGLKGFYVPQPSLPVDKDEMFNTDVAVKTNSNNWGFNFNISIGCNLSQFWIDNRRKLANCIGLSVAIKVLEMMKFSSQINNIEEGVKIMIIRDLEGAQDTRNTPLWAKRKAAMKALKLDQGGINKACLPCARKPRTKYGAIG